MRRLRFYGSVLKHAVWFGGIVAGVVTVLYGGSVLAAFYFLRHYHHHTWAVGVVGAGAVLAVLEGAHRVWDPVERRLQEAKARAGDLDTTESKRAYVDGRIARAQQIQRRIESLSDDQWHFHSRNTIDADIKYWENEVRARLAESFDANFDYLFDSNEGFDQTDYMPGTREGAITYLDWRITRLEQIQHGRF